MTNHDEDLAALRVLSREDDATDGLAARLDLPTPAFVDQFGGSWRCAIDDPGHVQWFASGVPIQVLLGVDERFVYVADAVETWASLAGPGGVDIVNVREFEPHQVDEIRAAVAEVRAQARRDWVVCDGCYSYGPVLRNDPYEGHFCRGCSERYFWLISC